jgi:hypothetical protein
MCPTLLGHKTWISEMCFQRESNNGPRLSRQLFVFSWSYSFMEKGHSKKKHRLRSCFGSNKHLNLVRSRWRKLFFIKMMCPSLLVSGTFWREGKSGPRQVGVTGCLVAQKGGILGDSQSVVDHVHIRHGIVGPGRRVNVLA